VDTRFNASLSPGEADDRLINSAEVRRLCGGIGTSTLDRWLNGEKRKDRHRKTAPLADFPKPIKIGDRNYWQLADVRRFIERRKSGGSTNA
jgi:predicted DNA-binding transcriptional regulator AlpA